MAHAGWRALAVAGTVAFLVMQLLLSQSDKGAASGAAPPASVKANTGSLDDWSPPGCVEVVGAPAFSKCYPCPPLWLGGPTIRCIAKPSAAVHFAPPALGFGVLLGRRCPGLPRWALGSGDAMLVTRLCAYSAGE
jgi:hypothetical protein